MLKCSLQKYGTDITLSIWWSGLVLGVWKIVVRVRTGTPTVPKSSTGAGAPPQLDANNALPKSADLMNIWNYISTPPYTFISGTGLDLNNYNLSCGLDSGGCKYPVLMDFFVP
jgi:hypothetical protein